MIFEDLLFEHLRNIIYSDDAGTLKIEDLPENLRDLGEGLNLLSKWMQETKKYSKELSAGKFNTKAPPPDNHLVDPLKDFQATLKHITWQAEQVTKGDYEQHVDFMGDFSSAFNTMVDQLKERKESLERSRNLLIEIVEGMNAQVVAVNKEDNSILYANRSTRLANERKEKGTLLLREYLNNMDFDGDKEFEIDFPLSDEKDSKDVIAYRVTLFAIDWEGKEAFVAMAEDVSEEKVKREKMFRQANEDELTGVYNRHHIMEMITEWLNLKKRFCLAFIDIDNLKYANDTFGHKEGDIYIMEIANLLRSIKGKNQIARIGGDEFLLLSEEADEEDFIKLLSKARKGLQKKSKERGEKFCKSFSYGVVYVESNTDSERSEILRDADMKMYKYKMSHKPKIKKRRK